MVNYVNDIVLLSMLYNISNKNNPFACFRCGLFFVVYEEYNEIVKKQKKFFLMGKIFKGRKYEADRKSKFT
jgi:predicted nucleotide-binding protein (sugar kinase/HSP70/actin superfamily)